MNKKELENAEQQIFGYYSASQGETLHDLLNNMDLTFKEYSEMKKEGMLSYLPDSMINEIESLLF